jgi:molybdopterin-binding protein
LVGALSARNQLPGTVEDVRLGEIMAHVLVRLVRALSKASSPDLKKGDSVHVLLKSTEVMIQKD